MARPIHLNGGRPSKYSRDIAQEILGRMCHGESVTKICQDAHLPASVTVLAWAEKHLEFGKAFERARRIQARVWAESTLELADQAVEAKSTQEIYGRQLQVNTRRWLAQRYDAETFGERVLPAGAGGGAKIHIYLPGKSAPSGDGGRVIEGQAQRLRGPRRRPFDRSIICGGPRVSAASGRYLPIL